MLLRRLAILVVASFSLFSGRSFAQCPAPGSIAVRAALLQWYPKTCGTRPWGVAFDGTNIWVTNWYGNNVTKLQASTGTVLGNYPTANQGHGIAFDGTYIWVATAGNLVKILASTGEPGEFCGLRWHKHLACGLRREHSD